MSKFQEFSCFTCLPLVSVHLQNRSQWHLDKHTFLSPLAKTSLLKVPRRSFNTDLQFTLLLLENCILPLISKTFSTHQCVWLVDASLGCLSSTVQNDVCAEFDTRRLFSNLSAEGGGGGSLCTHRNVHYSKTHTSNSRATGLWREMIFDFLMALTLFHTAHRVDTTNSQHALQRPVLLPTQYMSTPPRSLLHLKSLSTAPITSTETGIPLLARY